MPTTLHTVNKSPARGDALARCARFATDADAVLLIEDGVYAALQGHEALVHLESLAVSCEIWVLEPDVIARGIGQRLAGWIARVDDDGFVALAAAHARVVSWF